LGRQRITHDASNPGNADLQRADFVHSFPLPA
jgi:hypothetical protein